MYDTTPEDREFALSLAAGLPTEDFGRPDTVQGLIDRAEKILAFIAKGPTTDGSKDYVHLYSGTSPVSNDVGVTIPAGNPTVVVISRDGKESCAYDARTIREALEMFHPGN
jgi:hypothetical protein